MRCRVDGLRQVIDSEHPAQHVEHLVGDLLPVFLQVLPAPRGAGVRDPTVGLRVAARLGAAARHPGELAGSIAPHVKGRGDARREGCQERPAGCHGNARECSRDFRLGLQQGRRLRCRYRADEIVEKQVVWVAVDCDMPSLVVACHATDRRGEPDVDPLCEGLCQGVHAGCADRPVLRSGIETSETVGVPECGGAVTRCLAQEFAKRARAGSDELSAVVEGQAVSRAPCRQPAAEPPALFEHHRAEAVVAQQPGTGQAGQAGADHGDRYIL